MSTLPRSVDMLDDVYGMRFLVRTTFDVPIVDGVVQNEFRIQRALPTILHLVEKGARVIILTHVGRDPHNSTRPIMDVLARYVSVTHVPEVVGERAFGAVTHMKEGSVLLLENLRSCPGEESNDAAFARELASYGNFYVNEAFAVSHRAHASITTLPTLLPNFAGFDFLNEVRELEKALHPVNPSLFILGGAKFETKAPLVEKFVSRYTHTFLGGALANDFLKGKGHEIGGSLVSAVDLRGNPLLENPAMRLPDTVVVDGSQGVRTTPVTDIHKDERILDVGLGAIDAMRPLIQDAQTILWNGPLGYYEGGFDAATKQCAAYIAASNARAIVGGGDTVAAIEALGLMDSFTFVSTGGGAMLEYLEKGTLPGLEALTPQGT